MNVLRRLQIIIWSKFLNKFGFDWQIISLIKIFIRIFRFENYIIYWLRNNNKINDHLFMLCIYDYEDIYTITSKMNTLVNHFYDFQQLFIASVRCNVWCDIRLITSISIRAWIQFIIILFFAKLCLVIIKIIKNFESANVWPTYQSSHSQSIKCIIISVHSFKYSKLLND